MLFVTSSIFIDPPRGISSSDGSVIPSKDALCTFAEGDVSSLLVPAETLVELVQEWVQN